MAFKGIAAVLLPRGKTVYKTFGTRRDSNYRIMFFGISTILKKCMNLGIIQVLA